MPDAVSTIFSRSIDRYVESTTPRSCHYLKEISKNIDIAILNMHNSAITLMVNTSYNIKCSVVVDVL